MGLEGQVALVTGGSRGVGRGVARRLLEAGAAVVIASRGGTDLQQAERDLSRHGDVLTHVCDVADQTAVHAMVAQTAARFGRLDILVCSHGVQNSGHGVLDYSIDLWDQTLAINLRGAFIVGQAAAREMVKRGAPGRIINISSTAALGSLPGEVAYEVSKGGLESLTRAFAVDLAHHGITVNSVISGWVRTEMSAPHLDAGMIPGNALGRAADPEEIGSTVVWLCQRDASYVTGTGIVMDGGQHAILVADPSATLVK